MKVLVLNGSPRKNGKVSQILGAMEKRLKADGHETEFVEVNGLDFKCCIGCMKCREKGDCILPKDDAHRIGASLKACDAIVVGSPVYWGNISGKLKSLFDRQVALMMGASKMGIPIPLLKGKKALIVNACTTPFPLNILAGQSTKAYAAVKEILYYSGVKIKGKIMLAGTKNMQALPEKIISRAEKLAKKLEK